MTTYIVTREWEHGLDKKDTTWYVLFITNDYNKAKKFSQSVILKAELWTLHICKVPLDTGLDIVHWGKYKYTKPKIHIEIEDHSENHSEDFDDLKSRHLC